MNNRIKIFEFVSKLNYKQYIKLGMLMLKYSWSLDEAVVIGYSEIINV